MKLIMIRLLTIILCCTFPVLIYAADESQPTNGWAGEGELGFTSTSGNTDSRILTANLGISREIDEWKHKASIKTLQAETNNIESADSLEITARSELAYSEKSYLFGQYRYEDDEFSGFDYQTSLAFGIGSRIIENEQHYLDAYIGLGVRRLKNSTTRITEEDGIVTAGLLYENKISETATFKQELSIESGNENTYTESETSLRLNIDGNLSARIAYLIKRNSKVSSGTEKADKITTVSLVYGF